MPSKQRRPVTEPASPTPENDLYGTETTTGKPARTGRGTSTAASVATAFGTTRTGQQPARRS